MNGIPLNQLFNIDNNILGKSKVVGGQNGMNRTVSNVNVMEVPDIDNFVKPGDLLLTTAYSIKDNPVKLETLIPRLAKKNIAALAIRTKRYLPEIPEKMISMADQYKLPLIEITEDVSFSSIITNVLELIIENKAKSMVQVQEHIQTLTNELTNGGRVNDFLQVINNLISKPVALITKNLQVISSNDEPFTWTWPILKRYKSADHSTEQNYLPKVYYYLDEKNRLDHICIPIQNLEEIYAYLYCWDLEYPVAYNELLTLQHSAQLLNIYVNNDQAVNQMEEYHRDEFLRKWVGGEWSNNETIYKHASKVGITLNHDYRCAILTDHQRLLSTLNTRTIRYVKSKLRSKNIFYIQWHNENLLLIPKNEVFSAESSIEILLTKHLPTWLNLETDYHLAVSNVHAIKDLSIAYNEAKETLKIKQLTDHKDSISYYKKLGMDSIFYYISKKPQLLSHIKNSIETLIKYDSKHNTTLYETLVSYLRNDCSIQATARDLYCHYNSISYRLARIKKVINVDLQDTNDKFSLWFMIQLRPFLKRGS